MNSRQTSNRTKKPGCLPQAYELTVLRFDYNIDPLAAWAALDNASIAAAGGLPRTGLAEARGFEGLYTLWDSLLASHRGLLIDTCASGGRRIDLEILERSFALWFSDYSFTVPAGHCPLPEPDSAFVQNDWSGQQALMMGAYQTMTLTSVGAKTTQHLPLPIDLTRRHPDRKRKTEAESCCCVLAGTHVFHYEPYRFRSGGPAARTINWGEANWQALAADTAKFSMLSAALEEQRSLRPIIEGDSDFYALTTIGTNESEWAAYQVLRQPDGAGFVMAFRRCRAAEEKRSLQLQGLKAAQRYELSYRRGYTVDHTVTVPGHSLEDFDITLPSPSSSVLITIAPVQ